MNRRENATIIEDGIEIASPYPLCSKVELGKPTVTIHGREFPDAKSLDWLADAVKEKLARQPDPITGLVPCGCGGRQFYFTNPISRDPGATEIGGLCFVKRRAAWRHRT